MKIKDQWRWRWKTLADGGVVMDIDNTTIFGGKP